ncbi:DsbA family protein [Bradyrhizobium sp. WD16]|uniref:DsbA family protein n=1 Tax=Bradyrhizobium sp. WD16 TaxID=1521768 RepID=UPI0020A26737|nr:DsbA family protein [Bradyrhizobium sp. WD16]UTD26708.1 disulfide bond formation protein DsbA [Bradyrhizobium sp. WD16]
MKRSALACVALACVAFVLAAAVAPLRAEEDSLLSRDAVLRDAAIPAMGNPKGDITIVEFFDYQCPHCKKLSPELEQVIREDGQVRLVMKDWPILGPPSDVAARLVLAARYQDKYEAGHRALMTFRGQLTEPVLRDALAKAGVDLVRADADLATHRAEIDALLKRNNAQAEAFGFFATPSFIIGTFRVPGVLEAAMFKRAIADARAAAAKGKKK